MMELLLGKIGLYVAGALALVAVWFGNNKRQRKLGEKKAEQKMKEADNERAAEIRDRVERDLPERVREMDGAGFRD